MTKHHQSILGADARHEELSQSTPYNPLDYRNLGNNVANALLAQPVISLTALQPFNGAGIYAIYYTGTFPAYAPIMTAFKQDGVAVPIYIGKAASRGSRKGGWITGADGTSLYDRLRKHADSTVLAENLDADDFSCRYLVVDDVWIGLGETVLIDRFAPVWNKVIDGFGIHDPGKGRANQRRSMWDTLHPGRRFAANRPPHRLTVEELARHALAYLDGVLPPLLSTEDQLAEAESDER